MADDQPTPPAGTRGDDILDLPEGKVWLTMPVVLSADSLELFEEWAGLIVRKVRRRSTLAGKKAENG